MSKKLVIPCGDYNIVADIDATNLPEIPAELRVYITDKDNAFVQDICLVRQQYEIIEFGKDFVPIDKAITCIVWSDENNEDFTDDFEIGIYEEEEE